MNKIDYINIVNKKFKLLSNSKRIYIEQINNFYDALNKFVLPPHKYNIGDDVFLKQGTLMHGTYKNFDGLKSIAQNGLVSSQFNDGRLSKYLWTIGVWNLKEDCYLKDYINFYSGGTIKFQKEERNDTNVISYNEMKNINSFVENSGYHMWSMEQTKESRFMPSLVQDNVQIGIIFNGNNNYIKKLLKYDILDCKNINDKDVKMFVNPKYYNYFIKYRCNKDDFFTDRESAILFGIPSNFIEGILVGRLYEKDKDILDEIKKILPNVYICNLDGKVIVK